MTAALPSYIRAGKRALAPPPNWTVDQWADQRRILSKKAAGEAGRWKTTRTPYLREIMQELSPRSKAREVVFVAGAQVGKTETGNNFVGYVIDLQPGPAMFVLPTVDLAKRHSKQRIAPLVEETPALKGLVKPSRARDSGNTTFTKEFPGGMLIMTGANSAVGLRSTPIKFLITDEEDSYPQNLDDEGDPVDLAQARMRSYQNSVGAKHFRTSTPKLKGQSRIEQAYESSDQRKFYVPCPRCQHKQVLRFSQLKWPKDEPQKANYECENCKGLIEDHEKTWMLERGEWRKHNPDSAIAGFHLNSLYSPVGWFSWGDAAALFAKAQKHPEKLRVFVNTVLGEAWVDHGEAPDWQVLFERRESYKLGTAPAGVMFLTAGVDVQKDRIEYSVYGWAETRESWLVDHGLFEGDTSQPQVWLELDALLERSWPHQSGISLPLSKLAIDSGYATQDVYRWVRDKGPGVVLAVKGLDNGVAPIGQPNLVEVIGSNGRRYKRGVRLWPVATSILKSELYRWLKLPKPTEENEEYPPGYCHFPQIDREFFEQITAEQYVSKTVKGFQKFYWQKLRDRNEALDMRIYARAAAIQFGMDHFEERRWRQFRDAIELQVATEKAERESVIASSPHKVPAKQKFKPRPIIARDDYL